VSADGGERRAIYVLSDSTGETGAKIVRAAALQFRHERVRLRILSNMRDPRKIADAVNRAAGENALVVYTLVDGEQRNAVYDRAAQYGVQAVDLMGPLMAHIGRWLGERPVSTPGLLHQLDADYFRRIEAVEFAVKNDDGRLPRNFQFADMVLVGVSRTSKTPVCTLLAHKGYKVANLPLVPNVPPPKEIDDVDPNRVFALRITPRVLHEIRQSRLKTMGVGVTTDYAEMSQIQTELRWARDFIREHPEWTVIDVTNRAIEETAAEIVRIYEGRFGAGD